MKTNLIACINSSNRKISNSGKIDEDIANITGGFGLFHGVHWAKYFANSQDREERGFFILNKKKFKSIKNYFDYQKFDYSFSKDISLCCEESTSQMEIINSNFHLDNGNDLRTSFIYSPEKLFTLNVRAYFDNFGRREELLQKALVQEDIYLRNESEYAEGFNCSSSFRIFNSLKEANETIDKEMFDYLKEVIERDNLEGAFIIDYEEKYKLPSILNSEILKKDYNSLGNICAVGMVSGPPKVLTTHEDGITIVTNDTTTELPLRRYFNTLEGVCFDLGMWKESVLHDHYLGCCNSCKDKKISEFKQKVVNKIKDFENSDSIMFELVGKMAKKICYKIDYNNLKLNIVEKERRFN